MDIYEIGHFRGLQDFPILAVPKLPNVLRNYMNSLSESALRCNDLILFIASLALGDHTGEAYSNNGSTIL